MELRAQRPLTGPEITQKRSSLNWTQTRLCQEIRRAAQELGWDEPGVNESMVSRWENGKSAPASRYQQLLDLVFARTLETHDESWEYEMQRRAFLRYSLAAAGIVLAGIDDDPFNRLVSALHGRSRLDVGAVDSLQEVTAGFSTLYQSVAPGALVAPVRSHLDSLTHILAGDIRTGALRRRVASLAGETAILMGWLSQDRGDEGTAQRYYMSALDAADEAEDSGLGAYAIGSASTLSAFRSSPAESIFLLTGAEVHGFRADHATPSTRAWILSLQAEAHTRDGDAVAAMGALDEADKLLTGTAGSDEPRPRVSFFDQARLLGERGVAAVRLGLPHEGEAALDEALRSITVDHKIQSRLLTKLAQAHLRQGNIERACELAIDSLDIARDTSASVDDIRSLRHDLNPWVGAEALDRLDARLAA